MKFDVIVIGGGFAGAASAYFLAPHCSVLLLEREPAPGTQSSGRSAEQFTVGIKSDTMRGLAAASRPFFDSPPQGFAENKLLSPRGCLTVGERSHEARLRNLYDRIVSVGAAANMLSGEEALAKFPALRGEDVELAVYEPGCTDIDGEALMQGYLRGARAHSARIEVSAHIRSIEQSGDRWHLSTNLGDFSADVLVNAAGAWVDEVAKLAGVAPIGIMPMRRTAFTFLAPTEYQVDDWPHVFKLDRQWYLKPETGRFMGSLADEVLSEPGDVYPEDIDVAQAIANIEEDTLLRVGRPISTWAGLRNFVIDRDPVIGTWAADPRFIWAAAQGGCGVLSSPALGQLVAATALGREVPDDIINFGGDPAALGPDRLRGS